MLLQHTDMLHVKPHLSSNEFTHGLQITQLQRKLFADTQAQDLQLLQVRAVHVTFASPAPYNTTVCSGFCAASGLQQRAGAYGAAFSRSCGKMS